MLIDRVVQEFDILIDFLFTYSNNYWGKGVKISKYNYGFAIFLFNLRLGSPITFIVAVTSWLNGSFIIIMFLNLFLVILFAQKCSLLHMLIIPPEFLKLMLVFYIFCHSFTFNPCMSLYFKWISSVRKEVQGVKTGVFRAADPSSIPSTTGPPITGYVPGGPLSTPGDCILSSSHWIASPVGQEPPGRALGHLVSLQRHKK